MGATRACVGLAILVVLGGASGSARAELTAEVVKSFELPDNQPGDLVRGGDGAFYGTTLGGGAFNQGTIFRVDALGDFSRLHSFDGSDGQGSGALVPGADGALYGVSSRGGALGLGSVFRVDSAGSFSVVHSFSGPDGSFPGGFGSPSALILGSDGALYGTTTRGGAFDRGAVFRIGANGSFTLLHSLDSVAASFSGSYLVLAGASRVRGVINGGGFGQRVFPTEIFEIDGAGTFEVLHTMAATDTAEPGVSAGIDGSLYGAIHSWNGTHYGAIFKLDSAGAYSVLHTFDADAWGVGGPLFVASDGTVYGRTIIDREAHEFGTVFRIDPSGGFAFLSRRAGRGFGAGPLVAGSDGSIYGSGGGGVFKIQPDGVVTDVVFPLGVRPVLVTGADGALYGTTDGYYDSLHHYPYASYGASYGAVIRIGGAGDVSTLHRFDSPGGFLPRPNLAVGGDGAVYGATYEGGDSQAGTLFRISSDDSYNDLHSFSLEDMFYPADARGGVVQGAMRGLLRGGDGAIFGLTRNPGVFRVDPGGTLAFLSRAVGGSESSLTLGSDGALYGGGYFPFKIDGAGLSMLPVPPAACGAGGFPQGSFMGPIVLGGDGALYGIQSSLCFLYEYTLRDDRLFKLDSTGFSFVDLSPDLGPNYDYPPQAQALAVGGDGAVYGTTARSIFRLDGSGNLTTVHEFPPEVSGPAFFSPLVPASDGSLYATTWDSLFKIDAGGSFSTVHIFSGGDGRDASGPLTPGKDGSIYGTTFSGGDFEQGTVFKLDPNGVFSSIHSYSAEFPLLRYDQPRSLVEGDGGALYGVAGGGPAGGGVVYRLRAPSEPQPLAQEIQFESLADRTLGEKPFRVSAVASSALSVSFSAAGSCSVSGDRVTLTGPGLCTVTASQPGDSTWAAASDVSRAFQVRFDFHGFRRPIAAPPTVNQMRAGLAAKLAFDLDKDRGPNVLASGSPTMEIVSCDSNAEVKRVPGTATRRKSTLLHGRKSRRYTYLWKTYKSWAGTCRTLTFEFADGTTHQVFFELYAKKPSH